MSDSTTASTGIHTPAPSRAVWLSIVCALVVAALFISLFHNWVWVMIRVATDRWGGDWSHALVIPFIAGFYVYQQWETLVRLPIRVQWAGLAVLFVGIFAYVCSIYPVQNGMFQGYSMILALFGLVWFLFGGLWMRILWFPVIYLAFAVKVADRIWEQIAWKLQLVAARSAAMALNFLGVFMDMEAQVTGSTIELGFHRGDQWVREVLNVAEACSGLRMLAAFVALGVAVAFLAPRLWWQRLTLVLLTVPIAVAVNVVRVASLGVLHTFHEDMSRGALHKFVGLIMLIPALLMFLFAGWVLDRLIIQENSAGGVKLPDSNDGGGGATRGKIADAPPINLSQVGFGGLAGAGLAVLVGGIYLLLLGFLSGRMPAALSGTLLVAALIALILGGVALRRRTQRFAVPQHAAIGVAAGVLLTAAVGLQVLVSATRAVLIKQPVPLRQPLLALPVRMDDWELIDEEFLSAEIVETLRTDNYLLRTYRHRGMPERSPGSIMRLHVAYYTGTPDTVPHVPDRCYVAGGVRPIETSLRTLQLSGPRFIAVGDQVQALSRIQTGPVHVPSPAIPATVFTYADPSRPDAPTNVIYFFAANGKFLATPEQVRLQGFDLTDRYSYYCKIEIGLIDVPDASQAVEFTSAFLADVMPDLLACLPDWTEVVAGRWPVSKTNTPGG